MAWIDAHNKRLQPTANQQVFYPLRLCAAAEPQRYAGLNPTARASFDG